MLCVPAIHFLRHALSHGLTAHDEVDQSADPRHEDQHQNHIAPSLHRAERIAATVYELTLLIASLLVSVLWR